MHDWFVSMGIDMSTMDMMMGDGVCKEGYWTASMKASLDYLWNWYASTNRMEVCEAVNTMFIRSVNAWDHMCDDNKVYPAVIAKMLMIWDDLYMNYQFPNCDASTMNRSPLEC